jgi:hypothetical protein
MVLLPFGWWTFPLMGFGTSSWLGRDIEEVEVLSDMLSWHRIARRTLQEEDQGKNTSGCLVSSADMLLFVVDVLSTIGLLHRRREFIQSSS